MGLAFFFFFFWVCVGLGIGIYKVLITLFCLFFFFFLLPIRGLVCTDTACSQSAREGKAVEGGLVVPDLELCCL